MEAVKSSCCKNKLIPVRKASGSNGTLSIFSTILMILLPKCPLCITAYMGAILMFFDIETSQMGPFLLHAKPVLGIIILIMILLNNKGRKTVVAFCVALTALLLLVLSTYFYIAVVADAVLYVVFFLAIWYNGNFECFYRFIRFGGQEKEDAVLKTKL
ncbi:MAG: hypothetical protein WBG90_13950 [Saonia sp.]